MHQTIFHLFFGQEWKKKKKKEEEEEEEEEA